MKHLSNLIFLMILVPSVSQASIGWFLFGALVGSSSKSTQPSQPIDPIEQQIRHIENSIPRVEEKEHYLTTQSFYVPEPEVAKYFLTQGYKATYYNQTLSFDFSDKYANYLESSRPAREEMENFIWYVKWGLLVIFILFCLFSVPSHLQFLSDQNLMSKSNEDFFEKKGVIKKRPSGRWEIIFKDDKNVSK